MLDCALTEALRVQIAALIRDGFSHEEPAQCYCIGCEAGR